MLSIRNARTWLIVVAIAWPATLPAATTEADAAVSRLLEQANGRVAAGESPEAVEAWLGSQLKPFKATTRPPDWDVYGAANWRALDGDPGPLLGKPAAKAPER